MRAVKLVAPNTMALQDVPVPEPAPDEVLLKVTGAGLCHSDLHVLHSTVTLPSYGRTVGHEGAGTVAGFGAQVTGFAEGDPVLVSLIYSCGRCRPCLEGRDNACAVAAEAGVTPMHAVNSARHRLTPGSVAVVIAVGGLGHLGLQIIKATTAARVIAVDADDAKLDLAKRLGADLTLKAGPDTAQRILDETGGYGADAVFDFVGLQTTLDLAADCVAPEGMLRLVGLGGGTIAYGSGLNARPLPWGVNLQRSYAGTRTDQLQVIALAQQGLLHVETTTYPLEQYQQAFDDLEAGRITGRAVLVP